MEQGILHAGLQPGQIGAAPDEVPFAPEAGEPVPQVIAGISPDRRVAVQSERLAEDLDGQRLTVRQRRRRPTAAQTSPPENLPHGVFDYAVQPDQTRSMLPKALKPWKTSLIVRSRAEGSLKCLHL